MKRLASILAIILITISSTSAEVLFSGNIDHSGFGGPVFKVTQINGETGLITGGRGAWLINHRITIGGGGYSFSNSTESFVSNYPGEDGFYACLEFYYGGFEAGYIHNPDRLLHWVFTLLIGSGNVEWVNPDNRNESYKNNNVFVLEPTLSLEVNITTWMRIQLGGNYRMVNGLKRPFDQEELGGLSGVLALKFGAF